MEEKSPLMSVDGTAPPVPRRERMHWFAKVLFAVVVVVWVKDVYNYANSGSPKPHRYSGEQIKWQVCGSVDGRDVECSSINVPMDQFDKANSGNRTFIIPLARIRGKTASKNLVVNPGGPGGSGVGFLKRAGGDLRTIVGEDFHILSFDPRGVGESRPSAACFADEALRQKNAPPLFTTVEDSADLWAWTENFVHTCADTLGEHGKYINTPQTAADMNNVLEAVGQENMIYWGFSYGTLLGQTYATMYPEKSERVIIDGVVDQFVWYEGQILKDDFTDTGNCVHGFFDECIKAGDDCALSSLADSKDVLEQNVTSFLTSLADAPVSVYLNSTTFGVLNYRTMWFYAIFNSMYKPKGWYTLAENIAQLMQGNGTAALLQYAVGNATSVQTEHELTIHINDATSGPEHWPQSRKEIWDLLHDHFEASSFAISSLSDYFVRSLWRVPRTHRYVPRRGVKTRHPLLVLSTTYDPICPLVSARTARDAFVDSRLIEVKGYGHCSLAVKSTCMAKHIRDFLNEGILPDEEDAKCEVDGPYFIRPEDEKKKLAGGVEALSEDEKIHAAQMALSDALAWVRGE